MRPPQEVPFGRGVSSAILLALVTLLPFSLLLLLFNPLAGLAVVALLLLAAGIRWRTRQRPGEARAAEPRRRRSVGNARRILGYPGRAPLAFLAALLVLSFLPVLLKGTPSSSPGDPSSAGVIDYDVAWSPDSLLVAFDRSDYGASGDAEQGASDVFVARADGHELRRLTQTPANETVLGWLSNPSRVVYSTDEGPKAPTTVYALDLTGGDPVALGEVDAADELLALSHDARQALVGTPRGDAERYALVDIVADVRRPLPGTAAYWPDGAWSRDDSMLAYVTDEGIVVLRGERVLRHVPDSASGGLAWSPDGRRLAYATSWSGDSALWVVAIEGGSRTKLVGRRDTHADSPAWSPDGSTIYYENGSFGDHDGLRAIAPDGSGDRKVTDDDWGSASSFLFSGGKGDRWLEEATVSPDGAKIAYLLGERGAWKNWSLVGVMDTDGRGKTPFPGSS